MSGLSLLDPMHPPFVSVEGLLPLYELCCFVSSPSLCFLPKWTGSSGSISNIQSPHTFCVFSCLLLLLPLFKKKEANSRANCLSSPTSAVRLASGAGYKGLTGHSQRKGKHIVGRPANCGGGWKSKGTPQNKTTSNISGPNKAEPRRGQTHQTHQTHLLKNLKSMSQCLILQRLSNGFPSVPLKSSNSERCGGLKRRKASKQICADVRIVWFKFVYQKRQDVVEMCWLEFHTG